MSGRRNARRRAIQGRTWPPGKKETSESGSAPAGSRGRLVSLRNQALNARRRS